jgi:hypothetical protein
MHLLGGVRAKVKVKVKAKANVRQFLSSVAAKAPMEKQG